MVRKKNATIQMSLEKKWIKKKDKNKFGSSYVWEILKSSGIWCWIIQMNDMVVRIIWLCENVGYHWLVEVVC